MLAKIGLLLVVIVLVLTVFKRFSKQENSLKKEEVDDNPVEMKQDPVCGVYVEEVTRYKVRYYDKVYYFCSEECKQKFIEQKQTENRQ